MIRIIHELRRAKGRNKKLSILRKHKNNQDWLKFLTYVYDPHINYYVGPPKDRTFLHPDAEPDLRYLFAGMNRLAFRKVTGQRARDLAMDMSQHYGELARLILAGSINAGVSTKTINQAYPKLISTFDMMLGRDVPVVQWPVMSFIKYDGVRVLVEVTDTGVTVRTRSGLECPVNSLMESMANMTPGWYDGELVAGNGLQAGRTKITGQVNKVLKGTADDIDGYTYCMFDWMPISHWETRHSKSPYHVRYKHLLQHSNSHDTNLLVAPYKWLHKTADVELAFHDVHSRGYEGLILRYPEDRYVWDRSARLVKKKAIKEARLEVVGVKEGTGKYQGLIGALECTGVVEGKIIEVNVGSGLTDAQREWSPDEMIGCSVEVEFNDIVKAKGSDEYSLFLPRFKRIG